MKWPTRAVESIKPNRFIPPHCPWAGCRFHLPGAIDGESFSRFGSFRRRCDKRIVPRFFCHGCRRTFSQQTFATSYYLKRPELTEPIAAQLVGGSCHRQIARSERCHHSTVTRRSARLGRHALLLHELVLRELANSPPEPVIVDDFDTFAYSQYFPGSLPTAIGSRSWFVYGFELARERRRGRMSPRQKRQRAKLETRYGRPPRGSMRAAFYRLIAALPRLGGVLTLISDDDPAIRAAVRRLHASGSEPGIKHAIYANPKRGPKGSPRTALVKARDLAMFPNDQLHRFLRHSEAAHRRETIAFGRRFAALVERLALFVVWRNLIQHRAERRPRDGTIAMRLKLLRRHWSWKRALMQRLFSSLVKPRERVMELYRRTVDTAPMQTKRHLLTNAF